MNQIDLSKFAVYSRKIPSVFLAPKAETKTSNWKFLAAHFVDFGIAFSIASFMATFYNAGMSSLLMTDELRMAFSAKGVAALAFTMLPVFLYSYFFFSYFMNHGQSYGGHIFKHRVVMKSQSFKEAAYWALYSSSLCVTGGLIGLFYKKVFPRFERQDYLYEELIRHRDVSHLDLVAMTETEEEMIEAVAA